MTRKMKKSGVEWIDKIPKDWAVSRLKHIFEFRKGLSITKENLVEEGVKVISYGQIHSKTNTGVCVNDSLIRYVGEEYLETGKQSLVLKNDFIFADTSEDLEGAGNCVYINLNEEMFAGYHTIILKPIKNEAIDEWKYFAYLYGTDCWRSQIRSRVSGIKLFSITQKILKQIDVIVPDIKEQKKIVNFLDNKCTKIDQTIEKEKQVIEKLKEYKQSVITEAVTKGLNPDVKMKDSGVEWIGEIPEHWNIRKLKHTFSFKKGLSITKDNLVDKGIKVISYGQIHSKSNVGVSIDDSLIRYVGEEYLETGKQSLVLKNDFIFADTSEDLEGAGNYVYISENEELFAGYHTIILTPIKDDIMSEWKYFAYLYKTNCWRSQIRSRVSGIKLFSITQKILKQTEVIVPDIKEQREITDYLDKKCSSIDKLISDKEKLIQKLTEYKKSLIYECVTGKREVK